MKQTHLFLQITLCLLTTLILSFALIDADAEETATNRQLRLVIVGGSTVCDYPKDSVQCGWGMFIQDYFNSNRLQVINLALQGRSTKTFMMEGHWMAALKNKPDYVLIQFGHNDSHSPNMPEATDAKTTYRKYLKEYIEEARAIDAKPVLITPMCRRNFGADGRIKNELLPYADGMKAVAAEMKVPLVDLNAASVELCNRLGPSGSIMLANSPSDPTHFCAKGAKEMTRMIIEKLPVVEPSIEKYETTTP